MEDKHAKSFTTIAFQLPAKNCYNVIEKATIAVAILNKLKLTSYRNELKEKKCKSVSGLPFKPKS